MMIIVNAFLKHLKQHYVTFTENQRPLQQRVMINSDLAGAFTAESHSQHTTTERLILQVIPGFLKPL